MIGHRRNPRVQRPLLSRGCSAALSASRAVSLEALVREISLLRDAREVDRETIEALRDENAVLRGEISSLRRGDTEGSE